MTSLLPYLTAAVRWALGLLAGWLAAKGLLTAEQSGQFVNLLLPIALGLIPLGWSWWQKHRTAAHLQDAADAPAGSLPKSTPL